MSDNIAASQLRSFVERIERTEDRLTYVLETVQHCRGIAPQRMHRAFNLSAIVLGVDYDIAKACLRKAWAGRLDLALPLVGRLSENSVGFVYWAKSSAFPGAVKIGFSRDTEARSRALSSRYGAPVVMHAVVPGTMLAEMAEHCKSRSRWVEGEWFREAA